VFNDGGKRVSEANPLDREVGKTCSSCEHWRKIRDDDHVDDEGVIWKGPHGECNNLLLEVSERAWIWCQDDLDASLITRSDFGCVEYKAHGAT